MLFQVIAWPVDPALVISGGDFATPSDPLLLTFFQEIPVYLVKLEYRDCMFEVSRSTEPACACIHQGSG